MALENGNRAGTALVGRPSSVEMVVRAMLDNVRRIEDNRWSARCPLHGDRDNSLSVWFQNEILSFKCYAGCDPKAITDHLCELHPEYTELLGRAPKQNSKMERVKIAEDARSWYLSYLGVQPDVIASLPIAFTNDEVIFLFPGVDRQKVRRKGEKGAFWRGHGHTPDLWPLPGATVGEDIVITEGESDCIVMRALGFAAYAITKGAAAGLSSAVLIALRRRGARRIVVAMDADSAGRQAASKMVIAARQAGLAAIDLDLVAEGLIEPLLGHKDIRDAFKYGKGQDIVEAVRHLLYAAEDARPAHPRRLSEIMAEDRPTDFVVDGLVRSGGTTLLIGEPKLGKSQMALDIALAVARGEAFCGLATKKGCVIYYALEDGEDIVRERVRARGLSGLEEDVYIGTTPPVVEDDVSILEEHIDAIQPTLIIIDTLRAISVSNGRSENEASFADAIYRIAKLARERGVAAILIHHTVKATTGNPISDARGTSAIAGAVDVVAGLYRQEGPLKLAWRGRFGSGDMGLIQHPNGSFAYLPSVLPTNMTKEEYERRVEERLAKYFEACQKSADSTGRIDVKKVVIAVWGLRDGKYIEGSWNKTFNALDELVRRQKLRKKGRQYYLIASGPEPLQDTQSQPHRGDGVQIPLQQCNQGDTPPNAQSHDTGEPPATQAEIGPPIRPERVIRIADVPKQLMGYISWAIADNVGELTRKVAAVGRRAVELMEANKGGEVDKLLEPVKAELREAHALLWHDGDNAADLSYAIGLMCKVILANSIASLEPDSKAYFVVLATKIWRDVLDGRITADHGLRMLKGGENIIPELLPRIYDLSDPALLARSLRLLRINLPRI
jgi:5S rRNA maturation endonuclease (ribonuclease M5)